MSIEQVGILAGAVLAIVLLGWFWRWTRKRRIKRTIDRMPIRMVDTPTEKDKEAYELLRAYRREIWTRFGEEMQLTPRAISQIGFEVVEKIASVYYPEENDPQYKATVDGLLDLNGRVIERMKEILDKPLINKFRGLDIATILTLKKGYDAVRQHPVTEFVMSRPALRKLWQVGWSAANLLNPWYWGRKVFIEVGIETARRYFVTGLVTIVGEEAVMLYSGRRVRNEKSAAELLTAVEMIRTLDAQESVSAAEYGVLLRWLLKFKHIDDHTKLELLGMFVHGKEVPEQNLEEVREFKGAKIFLKAFAELAEASGPEEEKKLLKLQLARKVLEKN
jgi:hypothetical protein